ncbi:hypothetical protein [Salinibacterium sp. NK8237]|uniref:hypothetical protein n=1 Tax=Salinibacterium sp. NK8237 TaxID=2792038 RepID=UPI0018CF38EA|nr:hypothetical protein [Salinibacterium sp. NK8237]MBH0129352.1 hypothetical protein [Salinibacterium sp. NK8237]
MANIEQLAVNAVTDLIGRCPKLSDYIASNDRTPVTDGHIDVHSSEKKSNSTLVGRVPIQVKGRATDKKIKQRRDSIKFPVNYEVLRFLRDDGGGIYFYVSMLPDGTKRTVFYAVLAPYKIDRILNGKGLDQKSFSIPFKRFPQDASKIQTIVGYALEGRNQGKTSGFDGNLLEQMQSLTIYSVDGINADRPTVLNLEQNDFAVTAHTAGGLSLPVDIDLTVYPGSYASQGLEVAISCGEIEYLDPMIQFSDENTGCIQFSKGLALNFIGGANHSLETSIALNLEGSVRSQLKDLDFFLAARRGMPLVIDGVAQALFSATDELKGQPEILRDKIARLMELFDAFGLDDTYIDALELTADDKRTLLTLHKAIVRGEEVEATSDGIGRYDFPIGKFKIVTLVTNGSTEGHKRIIDPFDPGMRAKLRIYSSVGDSAVEEAEWGTVYEPMNGEDLANTMNLRLNGIVRSYEMLEDRQGAISTANQKTLDLIAAADSVEGARRDYLLDGANTLCEWTVACGEDTLVYKINLWQIARRRGRLSAQDKRDIRTYRRTEQQSSADNAKLREACLSILLEDYEELDLALESFTEADLAQIRSWPIWTLFALS